jgi:signal transduction histidine kinase
MNLVSNAITYTPRGDIVSIALAPGAPGTIALLVTDTGTGILEDDLPHVFERFCQADASRTRATGGLGLGLSIVRDLVQAMVGTVVAERPPEGGMCVTLHAASVATAAEGDTRCVPPVSLPACAPPSLNRTSDHWRARRYYGGDPDRRG